MLKQIEWELQNGSITKNRVLPITILFFQTFCFSLKKTCTKSWFDVSTTQMFIFILIMKQYCILQIHTAPYELIFRFMNSYYFLWIDNASCEIILTTMNLYGIQWIRITPYDSTLHFAAYEKTLCPAKPYSIQWNYFSSYHFKLYFLNSPYISWNNILPLEEILHQIK